MQIMIVQDNGECNFLALDTRTDFMQSTYENYFNPMLYHAASCELHRVVYSIVWSLGSVIYYNYIYNVQKFGVIFIVHAKH